MTEIVFVMAPMHNVFFEELADALSSELRALGASTSFSKGFMRPRRGVAFVVIAPHEHLLLSATRGVPVAPLERTICILTEQPGSSWFDDAAKLAFHAGAAFDINARGAQLMRERGIKATHLPLGYTRSWEPAPLQQIARDLDLLFMGGLSKRRARLLASYGSFLARHRAQLVLADNSRPATAGTEGFYAGEAKFELLSRARVLLNLHRGDGAYFEWLRVLEAIHMGTAVVSEHARDYAPLVPGEDFLVASSESLPDVAEELLADEPRRARMAEAALQRIRTELPLRGSATTLLEAAERLAHRPSRFGRESRRRIRPAGFERPLSDVLASLRRRDGPNEEEMRVALKRARLDALGLDRRLSELLNGGVDGVPAKGAAAKDTTTKDAEVVHGSVDRAALPPRVSIVLGVSGRADHVVGTLESLPTPSPGWELIVCDDRTDDATASVIAEWIKGRPEVEALLCRHQSERGLAAARNSAIGHARADYVAIVDQGDELYPGSIERLADALDSDPAADFAYGILERFDSTGSFGLSGSFAWNASRVAEEDYIGALAMVRRATLERLGGYTTDSRLLGWEHYDLWCRIADRGGRGHHLPEIAARQRRPSGPGASLIKLSVRDARIALAERSPTLFEGVDLELVDRFVPGTSRALAALEAHQAQLP